MNKKLIALALCHNLPHVGDYDDELWLPLIPLGKFSGRDGRSWDNADAEAVINNTQLPFILDIDHASELTDDTSASGWFTELKIVDNHIIGKLELNSKGRKSVTDKLYKYYSPAFTFDKNSHVRAFSSAGLTNKPNLDVPALNSEGANDNPLKPTQGELLMLAALLAALGLAADADQQTALNAVQTLKNQQPTQPDLTKFVPKATHDQVVVALNAAEKQLADKAQADHAVAVEVAINNAITDKKIAPADKDYYTACCANEKGLESFRQFVANKAAVIGDVDLPSTPPQGGETALNSEQKGLLSQLGLNEKDINESEK